MSGFPTPHLEKLTAALQNEKLPPGGRSGLEAAVERYHRWILDLDRVDADSPQKRLARMVDLLNDYRHWLDVDLIFDGEDDFLYRQKGQLKLDNSVIEEFLPRLIHPSIVPELTGIDIVAGPARCFSALYFESSLDLARDGGGMTVRMKAQDFAVSKKLYLKAAHSPDFQNSLTRETYLAYFVSECKTNLDKTMFQEAVSTAHDVKSAVSGARYYLLCEWLDMTPVSTAATDIDEVIVLRKAKRLGANLRSRFGSVKGRRENREAYVKFLKDHPLQVEMFHRLLGHLVELLDSKAPRERDVLKKGFF